MIRKSLLLPAAPLFFLTLISFAGCGAQSTNMDVAPVSGRVEFHGKPVVDVYVQLMPIKTSGSSDRPGKVAGGATDSEGKFTLSTYESGDGAIPGTHRVTVSVQDPSAKLPGQLPKDFTVEVKPEPNEIILQLEGK